ncbi:hypothetical protein [Haliangium ochraceum]|uniref:SRPBCC family protein n=1 Tax=Haliangium ochraceum (strain DSM 14365 / JCM 11303 / SMP-2) TaxID=502025 RepID=D0LXQ6_HALO1|nr:hypothetical protein [Haliangium ochraceum]ACY17811.1 conserved hypothetical protein [Haliangium ochraceum DSM 14365]
MQRLRQALIAVLAVIAAVLSSPFTRRWYRRWGATEEEDKRTLPGDEFLPRPRLCTTRAITIFAPVATVWSWLVQIGQGRGGFYSYESLENLAGCDVHDADRIVTALQNIQVGDRIRFGPEGYPRFRVVAVDRARSLVLQRRDDTSHTIWSFTLETNPVGDTRLLVRDRTDFARTLRQHAVWRLLNEPVHFVMERKMLLGLKERAERQARSENSRYLRPASTRSA